jgi:hypothetical protein
MQTLDAVKAKLAAPRKPNEFTIPRLICADGFSMSVQASQYHYCSPREDGADWTAVEVGFPSAPEEALSPYAEEPENLTGTVYGYVPLAIVEQVVADHGGLKAEAA